MKKTLIAGLIVVVVGLLGASIYTANQNNSDGSGQVVTEQSEQQNSEQITFSEDGRAVSYEGQAGVTALATLESLTTVNTQDSDFGRFVTGINGVEADSDTEFWSFYVNGEMSNEGAGTYEAQAGDNFEWKLEQLQ